jgi:DNA-binding response OmpR family regulator
MNDILIIDDTPENLTVLLKILSRQGYQVRPALSGEIALKAVREEAPDLILLDIMMPGMDGFEVCARLKSDEKTQQIPVIFFSALDDSENKIKGFEAGGVDYISKPFHTEEVLARVKTHLALRNMHLQLLHEIRERKSAQDSLRKINTELEQLVSARTEELNKRTERLAETNVALKVLLEKRDEDKKELEEQIVLNIQKLIFPYLEKLFQKCTDESQETLLQIIRTNLDEITSSFAHLGRKQLLNLTPTQIQIADLIKQGKTSKEIAALMNLSTSTVASHRNEIRRKLALTNKKINLQSVLTTNQ